MKRLLGLLFSLLCMSAQAQANTSEYRWQAGDFVLRYPTDWDSPYQESREDGLAEYLFLAQSDVENLEDRTDTIPFITLVWLEEATIDTDLYQQLDIALREAHIQAVGPFPFDLLGMPAIETNGISRDEQFVGYGRAVYMGDGEGALLIYGRSPVQELDSFTTIFNGVVASVVKGANRAINATEYGVEWYLQSTVEDGADGFLNLVGLAFDANNQRLYTVDPAIGVIVIDSIIGQVINQIPLRDVFRPTSIAIGADDSLYIGDAGCQCIRVIEGEIENRRIEGFGEGAPASITIAEDGTVYATDIRDNRAVVHAFASETDQIYLFEDVLSEQPLITIDASGRLLALVGSQSVYILDGVGFSPLMVLQASGFQATTFTIDERNNLVIGTENQGIFIFNDAGLEINRIGRIVGAYPIAGELVKARGVAIGDNGTVYYADSDGTFGSVTAVSVNVEVGRVGLNELQNGAIVQGNVDARIPQQQWSFMGEEDQRISLLALADVDASTLDLAIRLLDNSGNEIAFVDNDETGTLTNPFDAQLRDLALPATGQYIVAIEAVSGLGNYQLSLSMSQIINLESGRIDLEGELSEILPLALWQFEGQAGNIITLTMFSASGSLDPVVQVLGRNGDLLIENDDAENSELGINAQIVNFRLPNTGIYTVVASRFSGEGRYILQILLDE